MPGPYFPQVLALCVRPDVTIREVMELIDRHASGIALMVDEEMRLLSTVTDGDIRRAVLARLSLEEKVSRLVEFRGNSGKPITMLHGQPRGALLALMSEHKIQQLPLVDNEGRVTDLALLKDLQLDGGPPMQALIMAGGFGKRLMPLTEDTPKPMLPIGGRPLLELTLARLTASGVENIHISTHYLSEKIVDHFGDGSKFGAKLRYLQEDRPLGTGGALALLGDIEQTTLVINGDIVTDLDFRAMAQFHRDHHAAATMAVAKYDVNIPYGVVQHDGVDVKALVEKPSLTQFINAGIYLVEPRVQKFLAYDCLFNMTDLIQRLIANGERVVVFPVREYWVDVGQHADYERVQRDADTGRIKGAREPAL
jgi:dTDP-glucose pyrophosphorylase